MLRRIVAVTLVLAISWPGWSASAREPLHGQPEQEAQQQPTARVHRVMEAIGEMRSHIDRSQFDLEALLDELDYDAERIIRFVSDEIAFELYAGVLRGAQGTLMSRAGNSLDQSLLLATLLNDAGHEARIVRGTLDDRWAAPLLEGLTESRSVSMPEQGNDALDGLIEEMEGLLGSGGAAEPARSMSEESQQEILQVVESLKSTLTRANVSLAPDGGSTELLDEARDYFWVEYRLGEAPWDEAHPAFTGIGPDPDAIAVQEVFAGAIPAELQHRIRVQLFVTQRLGNGRKVHPLMTAWERPASSLIGRTLRFWNAPVGLETLMAKNASVENALKEVAFFLPAFNGALPEGAHVFDLSGNVVPADMFDGAKAGVFRNVGSSFNRAGAALVAAPGGQAMAAFEGQFLSVTFIRPGGDTVVHERTLVEANGDDTPPLATSLMSDVRLNVAVGSFPPAYVADHLLAAAQDIIGAAQAWEQSANRDCRQCAAEQSRFGERLQQLWLDHLALFAATDDLDRQLSTSVSYRAEPSLVAQYRNIWRNEGFRSVIDILSNARRAYRPSLDGPRLDLEAALRVGVAETLLETMLLPGDPDAVQNALRASQRAGARGLEPIVLKAEQDIHAVKAVSLSDRTKVALRQDLAEGYVVLLITDPERGTTGVTWWRIHPRTGQTLGMLGEGWGGAQDGSGEYPITLAASRGALEVVKRYTLPWYTCIGLLLNAYIMVGLAISTVTLGTSGIYKKLEKLAKALGVSVAELVPWLKQVEVIAKRADAASAAAWRRLFFSCLSALS